MTISQVSKKYGLSADTLRYYERIGLIPRVDRKANGVRDYRQEDCQMIEFVKYMRSAGMPVEVLVQYFELLRQGEATNEQRRQMLVDQREVLVKKRQEIDETLQRLENKISFYDSWLSQKEASCREVICSPVRERCCSSPYNESEEDDDHEPIQGNAKKKGKG